jgi:hypothetical protein
MTETSRDINQGLVVEQTHLSPAAKHSKSESPVHGMYVYVDNYIAAAVKTPAAPCLDG